MPRSVNVTHQGYLPCKVPSDSGEKFGLVVIGVEKPK